MSKNKYLYIFNYDYNERELCKLESKYIFKDKEENKFLFSDFTIEPSYSAFIKKRLEIISFSESYNTLIKNIRTENINIEGFKVEYVVLADDTTEYKTRLEKIREIGHCIEGEAKYKNPTLTYGLCYLNSIWYFGELKTNNFDWHEHKKKPKSFSNSISISIAKSLVNIASKANKSTSLLDACCGVGTILLEACFAGNTIEGCDINGKTCDNARENLLHFNYSAIVHHSDIKNITDKYDAIIIDLPYNLFTKVSEDTNFHIIESTSKLTNRLIIVSTSDITPLINNAGFKVTDYCIVTKKGKKNFSRKIWVCEKSEY